MPIPTDRNKTNKMNIPTNNSKQKTDTVNIFIWIKHTISSGPSIPNWSRFTSRNGADESDTGPAIFVHGNTRWLWCVEDRWKYFTKLELLHLIPNPVSKLLGTRKLKGSFGHFRICYSGLNHLVIRVCFSSFSKVAFLFALSGRLPTAAGCRVFILIGVYGVYTHRATGYAWPKNMQSRSYRWRLLSAQIFAPRLIPFIIS